MLTQAINLPVLRKNLSSEPTVFHRNATVRIYGCEVGSRWGEGLRGRSVKKVWDGLLLWVNIIENGRLFVFELYIYGFWGI